MSKKENPAFQKFPQQKGLIKDLMKGEIEFANICSDYAEVVDQISGLEHSLGPDANTLIDLIHLRLDLENDILDWLG